MKPTTLFWSRPIEPYAPPEVKRARELIDAFDDTVYHLELFTEALRDYHHGAFEDFVGSLRLCAELRFDKEKPSLRYAEEKEPPVQQGLFGEVTG